MSTLSQQRILVLGASGLIGHHLTVDLVARGHTVVPAARRFTEAQKAALPAPIIELPLVISAVNASPTSWKLTRSALWSTASAFFKTVPAVARGAPMAISSRSC